MSFVWVRECVWDSSHWVARGVSDVVAPAVALLWWCGADVATMGYSWRLWVEFFQDGRKGNTFSGVNLIPNNGIRV